MSSPDSPTPPAPAPLTDVEPLSAEDEAALRSRLGTAIPKYPMVVDRLLATLDATRAELARERKIAAETEQDNYRARKRLEAERDAARAALLQMQNANVDLCRQLDRVEQAHFNRDNLIYKDWPPEQQVRHLEARVEYWFQQLQDTTKLLESDLADADAAGRALVAALGELAGAADPDVDDNTLYSMTHPLISMIARHALAVAPTRWRTGEEPE